MQNSIMQPSNYKLNLRISDLFVDFLACLIPGFLILSILSVIFSGVCILLMADIGVL